jgi:hypothetical protein
MSYLRRQVPNWISALAIVGTLLAVGSVSYSLSPFKAAAGIQLTPQSGWTGASGVPGVYYKTGFGLYARNTNNTESLIGPMGATGNWVWSGNNADLVSAGILTLGGTATNVQLTAPVTNFSFASTTNGQGPTFTTRSTGQKFTLYPALSGSTVDFGIGVDNSSAFSTWFSVPNTGFRFQFFGGTTEFLNINYAFTYPSIVGGTGLTALGLFTAATTGIKSDDSSGIQFFNSGVTHHTFTSAAYLVDPSARIDSAGALSLGTSSATSLVAGRAGMTSLTASAKNITLTGTDTANVNTPVVTDTLNTYTGSAAIVSFRNATVQKAAIDATGKLYGAGLDVLSGALSLGTGSATSIAIGRAGAPVNLGDGAVTQTTNLVTGVTLNSSSGVITTVTATTAAQAVQTFTVTNSNVSSTSTINVSIGGYGGTFGTNGTPQISVTSVSNGSFVVVVYNAHAANALNGFIKVHFSVV